MKRWSLIERVFTAPPESRFIGGVMSTFGLDAEFVQRSVWPALYGGGTDTKVSAEIAPVCILADALQFRKSGQPRLGSWPVLCPPGMQHSKVWLLFFGKKPDKPDTARIAIGSHNLTRASFVIQAEGSFVCECSAAGSTPNDVLTLFCDARNFLRDVIEACKPTCGTTRPQEFLKRIEAWSRTMLPQRPPRSDKPELLFVSQSVAVQSGTKPPLLDQFRTHLPSMRHIRNTPPDEAIFVTPFFQHDLKNQESDLALESLTLGAKDCTLIGPAEKWQCGPGTGAWIKGIGKDRLKCLYSSGPDEKLRLLLHCKFAAWLRGSSGMAYLGSGNLTTSGVCVAPPRGNIEAGILWSGPRSKIKKWIRRELNPQPCDPAEQIEECLEPPVRETFEPCPLAAVIREKNDTVRFEWIAAAPPEWRLLLPDKTEWANQNATTPLKLEDTVESLLWATAGETEPIPVIGSNGLPFTASRLLTLDNMLEAYRRGRMLASFRSTDKPDERDEIDEDKLEPHRVRHLNDDPTYLLKDFAEKIQIILDHVRNMRPEHWTLWFERDLPLLLDGLCGLAPQKTFADVILEEFHHALEKEIRPEDDKASRRWLELLKAARVQAQTFISLPKTVEV